MTIEPLNKEGGYVCKLRNKKNIGTTIEVMRFNVANAILNILPIQTSISCYNHIVINLTCLKHPDYRMFG